MSQIIWNRKHPVRAQKEAVWERCRDAYSGGSDYIRQALIKHVSEIDLEFAERQQRAYYFNYPRAIAQRITQYALAVDPVREQADPALLEDWSRTGLRTNEVMRQLSTLLNVFGLAWLGVGSPAFSGEASRQRARQEKLRPFCQALSPLAVADWAYGHDGRLLWALVEEDHCDDADPGRPRCRTPRRRLWERHRWRLYEAGNGNGDLLQEGVNPAGAVPLIPITEPDGYGIAANHWFEDVVRISEAILNNESEAQMNTVKQMFGMLVLSESFARGARKLESDRAGGSRADSFAGVIARSAAAIESVEEKGISRYISPSGLENTAIREGNAAMKQELYDVVGLAIQSRSREAQTAEAKAWDFQNVTQFLAGRADLLEQAELEAWRLMRCWDPSVPLPQVTYNRKFAVRDLPGSIAGLLQLSNLPGAGIEYRKAILRSASELIDAIASIADPDKERLLAEISRLQNAPLPEFNRQDWE